MNTLTINIKDDFKEDFISRIAGEKLRNLIIEQAKTVDKIIIDFAGVIIASTSFFDEGFAKLILLGWSKNEFKNKIELRNMNNKDKQVLEIVWKNRETF